MPCGFNGRLNLGRRKEPKERFFLKEKIIGRKVGVKDPVHFTAMLLKR
jgi:hypothetical protein